MSEIIHAGEYTEERVYKRPPNTYKCDTCEKELGRNKGIELGLSFDINDYDTEYENANFCSFSCLHKYPKTTDAERFKRSIRMSQNHDLYINGFRFPELLSECSKPSCTFPVYKIGLCTEHFEERVSE